MTTRRAPLVLLPLVAAAVLFSLEPAAAHVKWFCAFDVAGQPRGLENVLCQDFEFLVAIALLTLTAGCCLDGTPLGEAMLKALDRVTFPIRDNTELLFRAGIGFFFVSLWTLGGIILTPELKTSLEWVQWLQLAIAAGMLSRYTMPLSGVGIVYLFGLGVRNYGAFHLADYPIFLGVATYLILTGLERTLFGMRPLDVVRYAAGITLMWASVEKWAYPEWSFPLFVEHPGMTMGFSDEFFMRAAGVVEFTLAFALIWTPLVRRMGAIVLTAMFISACFEFGKIDVIGHSAIIVALCAIAADDRRQEVSVKSLVLAPVSYLAALALYLAVYYAGHAALFGSKVL